MSSANPAGILDFFVLEASEYVEQLDSLLQQASAGGPDADAMQKIARALRGSAAMAKLPSFSDVAAGIERVGRALREGGLSWNVTLGGAVVSAVDDCKILLHNVRAWSDADEARARARISELTGYAPPRGATPLASPTTVGHDAYLATEASNIGAGLELIATRPTDRDSAANVLRRVRALRGIASVKDHPALSDVLEAAEEAAHTIERGLETSPQRLAVLHAAASVLRGIASNIRSGSPDNVPSAELSTLMEALDVMQEGEAGTDVVIPISQLFFDDGAGVVQAANNPPSSAAQRFRLEAVSQGEHLRRVISDARGAHDEMARERVRRALRSALRALKQSAESFGEAEVASFLESRLAAALRLDAPALGALDEVATVLAQPGNSAAVLSERIRGLTRSRTVSGSMPAVSPVVAPQVAMPTPAAPSPVARPTPSPQERIAPAAFALAAEVPAAATPAERLGALLDSGIASLGSLGSTPLSAPIELEEQPPVPIDVLLYRGRAAIERCREIRDEVRRTGGNPDADALGELFDLLDLALTT